MSPNSAHLFNTANAHFRGERFEQAQAAYQAVLEAEADFASAHLGVARCCMKLGQPEAALKAFAQVLMLDCTNYSAWLEQGHALRMQGRIDEALASYQKAQALKPQRFEAPLGMVRTLESMGRLAEAKDSVQATLALLTGARRLEQRFTFLQRLGRYRLERGDLASAFELLRQARALTADLPEADQEVQRHTVNLDLAEVLLRDRQDETAHRLLTEVSHSDNAKMLFQLAELAYRFNLHAEAVAVMHKRTQLQPQEPMAWLELASMQVECWLLDEAEAAMQRALALFKPDEAADPNSLLVMRLNELQGRMASKLGDAETAFRLRQSWLSAQAPGPHLVPHQSGQAMTALYCDFLSPMEVLELHRSSFAHLGQGAAVRPLGINKDRIHLGLVSADLHHQHPVNIFMQPILRELDRVRYKVTVYFTGASYDEETAKARGRVDHWIEATYLSDQQLAARIAQDQINVLVDLSGHTSNNRMRLFAQRAAPVQVTYLGYPGSTGVPNMDWILGDSLVTPIEHQALYSERIARLDGNVFCYAPEVDYPFPEFTLVHAKRPLTFGSFNNLSKVSPRTLRLWLRILKALPEAHLLLKAPSFSVAAARQYYLKKLDALGFDTHRVELQGPVGLTDMMAQYEQLDIALDPVPYNGGTTTLQAMWMGVPVVCQAGGHFVSRMSAAFMTRLGLPDWVAHTDDGYVAIAVAKAQDRAALLELKQSMRARQMAHPAWNPVLHTRSFERCLQNMV